MPTTYGFTGQRSDPASGLSYYQARYYDPAAGQFTSADSVVPGGGFNLEGIINTLGYSYFFVAQRGHDLLCQTFAGVTDNVGFTGRCRDPGIFYHMKEFATQVAGSQN